MPGLEDLLSGRTLVNRYRIEGVIGRGGFAAVYRADDERLGRPVAVKVMALAAPDAATREEHRERFEREARAAASLPPHPNVVAVYDFGTDPELQIDFLVMELLHGDDLAALLAREGRPPLDLALRIVHDVAEGLAVGHRQGLIHRDVKPGNVFLAEAGGAGELRVCVLDFGIARMTADDETLTRLTRSGIPLSPAYASPEQTRGERDLTPASDVFSLGVVAYQLLTGEKPFSPERGADPADWVPKAPIRELNPEVPAAVAAVVDRALAFRPADRFADAEEMSRALTAAEGGVAPAPAPAAVAAAAAVPEDDRTLLAPTPAPPRHDRHAPPPRRSRAPAWVALLLLAAAAFAVWAYLSRGGGGGAEQVPLAADSVPAAESPAGPTAAAPEQANTGAPPPTVLPIPGAPTEGAAVAPGTLTTQVTMPPVDTPRATATGTRAGTVVDTVTPRTDSARVRPDTTRPPPRLLGVPADQAKKRPQPTPPARPDTSMSRD